MAGKDSLSKPARLCYNFVIQFVFGGLIRHANRKGSAANVDRRAAGEDTDL